METKKLKMFILFAVGFFLAGCQTDVNVNPPSPDDGDGGGEEIVSSGACAKDKDCKDACGDIFKHRANKKQCLDKLPVRQVELLQGVYDILKKPSENALNKMKLDDLQVLLGISTEPFETLAGRMSATEAKRTLNWLAKNNDPVEVVKKEDGEFKILKELLKKVNTDADTALSAPISRGNNFIEVATDEDNDLALAYVHEFFEDDCGSASNYEECVFKNHYCDLDLNDDTEESYLGYPPFDSLLEEVLETARPTTGAPSWWTERTDIDDIDTWLGANDVCGKADFS